MSFFDLLNGLLGELEVPYYEGQPELGRTEPETFVSYSVYDVPSLRGCGEEQTTTYYVTINIYSTGEERTRKADTLGRALTSLFVENGFVRRSGGFGLTNDFPGYYHRIIDFYYDYEEGDDN